MAEIEEDVTLVEELFNKTKDYLNTRLELIKLRAIKKGTRLFSAIFLFLFLAMMFILIMVLLSVGLALYLGEVLGGYHFGFFIVGGLYILIGALFLVYRKKLFQNPVSNWLIKNLMD